MELKIGKRYLIIQNIAANDYAEIDADFENKEIDTGGLELIREVLVNEISISGKYVKFDNSVGSLAIADQWSLTDSINVLEELPDKKIKDSDITQNNIYEKLIEVLTKILDNKINKHKIGKKRKCVKSGFGKCKK